MQVIFSFQKDVLREPLAQLANGPLGHSFSFNSPTTSSEFLLFLTWLFCAAIPNPQLLKPYIHVLLTTVSAPPTTVFYYLQMFIKYLSIFVCNYFLSSDPEIFLNLSLSYSYSLRSHSEAISTIITFSCYPHQQQCRLLSYHYNYYIIIIITNY